MKKIIFSVILFLFFAITIAFSFFDTNPGGSWSSSSGYNSMAGQAYDLHTIPGGYSFRCSGGGTCYTISGSDLWINDVGGSGFGPYIDVIRY